MARSIQELLRLQWARSSCATFPGAGQLTPAVETGRPASGLAQAVLPVSLTMAGEDSEILFLGAAPGTVGVVQVNARVTGTLPTGTASAPLVLTVGSRRTTTAIRLWVK
ncbi:MAG: hypothetical protein EBY17_26705 [Acidobacteriia bacterium]|nr:hypothetical protein [Terriglobia bacterium]